MSRWRKGLGLVAAVLAFDQAPSVEAAPAGSIERWRPLMETASARCGVPVLWVEKVMQAESGGRTMLDGRLITSSAGAMGLMQLMPATWREMRVRLALGTDPFDPADNILAGTCYLRRMYDRFGYPGAFAAYNAGPSRYAEHLANGRALPSETRAYLAKVTGGPASRLPSRAAAPELFFVRRSGEKNRQQASEPSGIFVSLSVPQSGPAGE